MTLKSSAENQLIERAVCVPRHLEQKRDRVFRVGTHRRCRRTGVMVHGHPEFFAGLPNWFIASVMQLLETTSRRSARQKHSAMETLLAGPANFLDRIFNVMKVDLHNTSATTWVVITEVNKPAIVCLQAGPTPIGIGLGHRRRLRRQRGLGEKRRNRVGVDDLCCLTIGLKIGHSASGVPIAATEVAFKVFIRIFVIGCPGVEILMPLRFQIRPVIGDVSPGMPIGRNDDVSLFAAQRCPLRFGTAFRCP